MMHAFAGKIHQMCAAGYHIIAKKSSGKMGSNASVIAVLY